MEKEKEFKYDPEAEEESNANKYRLPFALCKSAGIPIQDWWTPRDAWSALKNNGNVEDVSEEYKEYYRKLKREQSAQSRQRNKPRVKARAAQRKDPEHNPDKSYRHVDGAISGAKKGAPMTFEQADSGNVNPHYAQAWNPVKKSGLIGYKTNCQTCVATFIARRMGYDVRALPNLDNEYIFTLSTNSMLAYVDKNGNHPSQILKKSGERTDMFLDKNVREGRIYSVSCRWGERNVGHIVTAERINGQVVVYDPQTNKKYQGKGISKFLKNGTFVRLADLTDCKLDEEFCDHIMKKRGEK